MPIAWPMALGSTPNDTRSHSESIWMPNTSASFVRFVARAIFPSNISQRPQSARPITAGQTFPSAAAQMLPTAMHSSMYVRMTDTFQNPTNFLLTVRSPFQKIISYHKARGDIFQERDLTRRTLSAIL